MSEIALLGSIEPARRPDLGGAINPLAGIILGGAAAAVVLFVAYSISAGRIATTTAIRMAITATRRAGAGTAAGIGTTTIGDHVHHR